MKEWEDIIKDKLEGYESPLPEGSLAEFRARREASRAASDPRRSESLAAADARREESPVAASSRNDSTAGATAKKRTPLIWILPTAAAAVLAAALFLRKPNGPDDIINTVQQPSNPVVAVADSVEATEPMQMDQQAVPAQSVQIVQPAAPKPLLAQAATPKSATSNASTPNTGTPGASTAGVSPASSADPHQDTAAEGTTPESAASGQTEPAAQEQEATPSQALQSGTEANNTPKNGQQPIAAGNLDNRSTFSVDFPEIELQKSGKQASYNFNVLATAGGALGAGLLTTLLTSIDFGKLASHEPSGVMDMRQAHAAYLNLTAYLEENGINIPNQAYLEAILGILSIGNSDSPDVKDYVERLQLLGIDPYDPEFLNLLNSYYKSNQGISTKPSHGENPQTNNLLAATHRMPIKIGLSVRTPVAQKLYLTTGLDFSRYTTVNTYSLTGESRQYERYLDIPLRLDWAFVSGKRFDLYAGVGVKAEWCLAGSENFSASLLGVGGVQLNLTDWLGFYVEPELSWKMSIDKPTATTYRSEHPLLFTVGTGLRFTI